MNHFAVIDTNVIVSALLTSKKDSATVQVISKAILGEITPVINDTILSEYKDVLTRQKFNFPLAVVNYLITSFEKIGVYHEPKPSGSVLKDMDDLPFFEVALELNQNDCYLITGNTKHFPKLDFIVSPREYLELLNAA